MWPLLLPVLAAPPPPHGTSYTLRQISAAGEHLWAVTDGWGIIASHDGGATWTYYCEEGLDPPSKSPFLAELFDVEALDDGTALLAGVDGLLHHDGACGLTAIPGLPPSTTAAERILEWNGAWYVTIYTADDTGEDTGEDTGQDGVYRCSLDGCAPTGLTGSSYWVNALYAEGPALWASASEPDDFDASLWRTADGETWEQVGDFGEDRRDMYVLHADGDVLLVWAQGRYDQPASGLLRSEDGGETWSEVLTFGTYQDPVPALLAFPGGQAMRLGNATLHVYETRDGGATWLDANTFYIEATTLLCVSDDGGWACADQSVDGFDVGQVVGLDVWPRACMDEVEPAPCLEEGCALYTETYLERGAYFVCEVGETGPAAEETGCGGGSSGCGGRGGEAGLVAVGLAWGARRRRR